MGDGHACYGHLLHEVQKTGLGMRVALSMLDQGCREILTTSGPFTVLVPSLSSTPSRTTNVRLGSSTMLVPSLSSNPSRTMNVRPSPSRCWLPALAPFLDPAPGFKA